MSDTKWTKGKWTVGFKGEYETHNPNIVYAENGDSVASVWGVPLHTTLEDLQRSNNASDSEGMANARLIARAPEMAHLLGALTLLIRNMGDVYGVKAANWLIEKQSFQDAERLLKEIES